MAAVVPAFSQSVTHWIDRQVHGTARHITPRHHKPGEPTYTERVIVTRRPMRIVRTETVITRRHRHHTWHRHH
jgi:hypothetical protein